LQVAQDVLRGLIDGGVSVEIDEAKLERHLRALDELDFGDRVRELEKSADHLGRDLEHSMKELDHHLDSLHDLAEPMREFSERMGEVGRGIGDAVRAATDEMRAILERAIERGQARPIK
jgi:hypothetical protein